MEGCPTPAVPNAPRLQNQTTCLFAHEAPASTVWGGLTAKVSSGARQILHAAKQLPIDIHSVKTNKQHWLGIILLLSILYSFYHGKITCNITRLYLQFHFYKMSLQDCWGFASFFFFVLLLVQKLETTTHARTKKNLKNIHTHPKQTL